MGEVLRLSAFSTNIRDRLDYSCALFDARGRLCAQAAHIPVHLGSMAYAMRDIVNQAQWQDGDMLVINDPFKGGTHLPDVTLIAPLFVRGQLMAFVVNRAHHADIGASTPGSMPLSQSLHEEGIVLSLQKVVAKHHIQHAALDQICASLSNAAASKSDFIAQISANQTGLMRLKALIDEQGKDLFGEALIQLNAYGQRFAARFIAQLPPGEYTFTDLLDDDGFDQRDIPVRVTLRIDGKRLQADFSASSAQVSGNLNCPLSVTAAAVYYVFRCLLPPETPACAGTFSLLDIIAPPGSLLNARYPAAVAAGNVETSMRVVDVMLGALAQCLPERIPAASYGSMNNIAMGAANGVKSWHYYETIGGGMGANATYPGLDAVQAHMTNTLNTPIESLEHHFPLRIHEYAIRRGSGGQGKQRGGEGIIRAYELLEPAQVTLITERRRYSPWGLAGGGNGKTGVNFLNGKKIDAKTSFHATAGDIIRIETPGGGGFLPKPDKSGK